MHILLYFDFDFVIVHNSPKSRVLKLTEQNVYTHIQCFPEVNNHHVIDYIVVLEIKLKKTFDKF